ncbi:dihydrodipicolinate synthase family protein [Limnochorda pilosa]|uniref:Dihydrodipicolinate synthetase n=1 Tax=Limnochorda pilosa TaxID=1555112 RepID=A0A0K2SMJ4_LIMPI|nr:dihydrodipicolinate synthase family protein [Limnochorda pilosa]BAS28049.1 dihydrodipicolinate synthetase [Limnochorda pilosa]
MSSHSSRRASDGRAITEAVLEEVRGRVPVFVQVGAIRTSTAVTLAQHARDAGADGVAAITPYYYGYSSAELSTYYGAISHAAGESMPVYLYDLPARTGNRLSAQVVGRLAASIANVVGMKDSSGNLTAVSEVLAATQDADFDVLQGADEQLLPALSIGCKGSVSGHANAFPDLYVHLWEAFRSGDLEAARSWQRDVARVAHELGYGSVPAIKEALRAQGFGNGLCRPPLLPSDEESRQGIQALCREMASRLGS